MADALRPADRVRREDGRTGVLNGVFAEAVAWVSWDDDRPGYESIEISLRWNALRSVRFHQSQRVFQVRKMLTIAPTIRDHNGRAGRCLWPPRCSVPK